MDGMSILLDELTALLNVRGMNRRDDIVVAFFFLRQPRFLT